jgi:hypothetical protein
MQRYTIGLSQLIFIPFRRFTGLRAIYISATIVCHVFQSFSVRPQKSKPCLYLQEQIFVSRNAFHAVYTSKLFLKTENTNKCHLSSVRNVISFIHCECITVKLIWLKFKFLSAFPVLLKNTYEFGNEDRNFEQFFCNVGTTLHLALKKPFSNSQRVKNLPSFATDNALLRTMTCLFVYFYVLQFSSIHGSKFLS